MARLIEARIANTATGQSYRGAGAGFAERDMCSANTNGSRDTAFSEVQTDPGRTLIERRNRKPMA
jgi:hypothetical protein